MLKLLLDGLCDLVYPPNCLICKKHLTASTPRGVLCLGCREAIPFNIPPFCPKCSRHLGERPQAPRCCDCLKSDPQFDFAWGACFYHEPLRLLIHQFKYGQKPWLSRALSGVMISFIEKYCFDIRQFDGLVPVPLHPTQLRERGYNQARLLAQGLSGKFRIPLMDDNLIKVHNTKHQALLREKERWTNIHGAFRIKNPDKLKGKAVLIVDDLLTTGATASEAAKTLKESGANTIGVFALAINISNH